MSRWPNTSLVLVLLAVSFAGCDHPSAAPAVPPPPSVSIVEVKPERVALTDEWVATLDGYVNAQIRPQVTGYLIRRGYVEGGEVRKGQVLFEIDPRPFAAALAQARAHVGEAQVQLGKAQRDVARDQPLAEQRAIPRSQFENDQQAALAGEAAVQSADAEIQTAELNLSFTKVTSLIDGVAGIATAQIGDLVTPTTLLTTVSQLDPIKAYFPLSEQQYLRMTMRRGAKDGEVLGPRTPLTLILADGSVYEHRGQLLAVDREIDLKTGTIRVGATFPNPARTLRPGQYGRVRAATRVVDGALLVPQRAVSEVQGTYQIRVVGDDDTVGVRTVTVGARVGNRWIVASGLEPGVRVVVEGAPTKNGDRVTVKPFAPSAE